jgi:hypothetical protein
MRNRQDNRNDVLNCFTTPNDQPATHEKKHSAPRLGVARRA